MTGWTYTDLMTSWADHIPLQLQTVAGVPTFVDASGRYQADIPYAIAFAEGLMYRDPDLDFLATRTTDSTQSTVAGSRYVTIPAEYIIVERLNLILPASSQPDANGSTRIPLIRTTSDVIETMWPETSNTATPQFGLTHWAIFGMQETSPTPSQVRIAPTPDGIYVAEFKGTFRPAPLAQTANAQTFLTEYLPDVFFAATMIHWSGIMKNYGAAGTTDDAGQGINWMSRYTMSKKGAAVEEARKKALSAQASVFTPAPLVAQPR